MSDIKHIDIADAMIKIADVSRDVAGIDLPLGAHCRQAANEITDLRARLEKAEAERDAFELMLCDEPARGDAERCAARNDALEEAAKNVDCECKGRDVVLSPNVRSNSRERWEACGDVNCCALAALDIRLLKTSS